MFAKISTFQFFILATTSISASTTPATTLQTLTPTTPTIGPCSLNSCRNGGACTDNSTSFNCICTSGWTGNSCAVADLCDPNPCRNGGICLLDNFGYFICICVPGWTDNNCTVEINHCESFPCHPFGRCEPRFNGYSCTCRDGYERVDNNDTFCRPIDHCANSQCLNDGTCVNQNELNRYYCICPQPDDGSYLIGGLRCENVGLTTFRPVVDEGGISPNIGIIAGGANLTITGRNMNIIDPLGAYFRSSDEAFDDLDYGFVIPEMTTESSIVIKAPLVNEESYVNRTFYLIVEYSGPINVSTNEYGLFFTLKGNPSIDKIEPTTLLAAGGVTMTVSGNNMDVVQDPVMVMTTIVTANGTNYSIEKSTCSLRNTSAITCRIPEGIVPLDFLEDDIQNLRKRRKRDSNGAFHFNFASESHGKRRKKRSPVANITHPTGNSTFLLYLGFELDDLPTYENISKSLPEITFVLLTSNPVEIHVTQEVCEFDPTETNLITISGNHFLQACSQEDYLVHIGNSETCEVSLVTENQITCLPPEKKPDEKDDSSQCSNHGETFAVMVHYSRYRSFACCLKYKTDNTAIIIGVSVAAGVVVIVVLIIIIVVVITKEQNQHRKKIGVEEEDGQRMKLDTLTPEEIAAATDSLEIRQDDTSEREETVLSTITGGQAPAQSSSSSAAASTDYLELVENERIKNPASSSSADVAPATAESTDYLELFETK